MNRNKRIAFGGVIAAILLIAGIACLVFNQRPSLLSEQEIKTKVEAVYPGKVTKLELSGGKGHAVYTMLLKSSNGAYDIQADAVTGNIVHVAASRSNVTDNTPAPDVAPKPVVTEEQAERIALSKSQGDVTEVKKSKRNGKEVYVVTIQTKNHGKAIVEVSADTGDVVYMSEVEDAGGTSEDKPTLQPKISAEQAKKIAIAKVKGTVHSVELEDDDDTLLYEVEIITYKKEEVKIEVHAYTGEVLSISWED
ncbi:PepSY domain-containing protein [Paenibacillus sp. MER TA 81-3]|uniref:PepSY domain-containing protein n=1 Tax=Paenibacillus sp. MER TA 81-3 TaxID=2939573 RepID=UPI00204217E3|nr:PepSY domain-containing protein [Paenibacillus sp. MER TA 81-3]MCM3341704.1 PepSY domain-containing protein [Paenibacillus sp. MER TA 81-3]